MIRGREEEREKERGLEDTGAGAEREGDDGGRL
jgi:hypothetical protein